MSGRRRRTLTRALFTVLVIGGALPVARAGAQAVDPPLAPTLPAESADPFLVSTDQGLLVFTTNADGANVPVWSSSGGASGTWTRLGDALPVLPPWAQPGRTWAPGVVRATTGTWLLYFSAWDRATGLECIGRASASSPTGPYASADGDRPFLCHPLVGGSIDPSPFLDPWDERLYLYWKNDGNCCGISTSLWGLALTPDGGIGGPLVELLRADAPWERGIVERPAMVRWASGYDVFYSGGSWATPWYGEGWARCSGPLGPCTKQSNTAAWVDRDQVAGDGPGGMSVAVGPEGRLLAAWHAWPDNTGYGNGGTRRTYLGALTMPSIGSAGEPVLHALDATAPVRTGAPPALLDAPSGFTALPPTRVLDTRRPGGAVGRLVGGAVTRVALGSVPALEGATAVSLNATVTRAAGTGYLTAWPCDRAEPDSSIVNMDTGVDVANGVTVGLDPAGVLCVRSTVDADLLLDVTGRWAPFLGDRFSAATPVRLVDTRRSGTPPAGTVVRVEVGGNVPAGTHAVALNVTATRAHGDGYVTTWACDDARPDTSTLNLSGGRTRSNNVVLASGPGAVCLVSTVTTDLLVDLTGSFGPTGSLLTPTQPTRVADTRLGRGDVSRLARGGTIAVHVAAGAALPSGTTGVLVNVTATDPAAAGFVTAYPCRDRPDTSTLNLRAWGGAVANGVVTGLPAEGDLCVFSSVPTDVIVDLLGYLSA